METVPESEETSPDRVASSAENASVSSDSVETGTGASGKTEHQLYYGLIDKINAGIENNFADYSTEDLDVTSPSVLEAEIGSMIEN